MRSRPGSQPIGEGRDFGVGDSCCTTIRLDHLLGNPDPAYSLVQLTHLTGGAPPADELHNRTGCPLLNCIPTHASHANPLSSDWDIADAGCLFAQRLTEMQPRSAVAGRSQPTTPILKPFRSETRTRVMQQSHYTASICGSNFPISPAAHRCERLIALLSRRCQFILHLFLALRVLPLELPIATSERRESPS